MAEKDIKLNDEIFDKFIISKKDDPFKDMTPLFSDQKAFKVAIDSMVEKLTPLDKSITKIVCPAGDTTFASALAYNLGLGVVVMNPYDGREREDTCKEIVEAHLCTAVDNRGYLLIFNNRLPKQHFKL